MVRRQSEQGVKQREQMYEGQGTVELRALLNGADEMSGKGRLFSVLTVPVGGSIGYHVHEGESETYYFLQGTGVCDDNGVQVNIGPGDVVYTAPGEGHSVRNTGAGPLAFVALILYQ